MVKRQKTDLNAQMIWMGDENDSNALAMVLKFLKYWGVRLPYQFSYIDQSVDFQDCEFSWDQFVVAHKNSSHYQLRTLASQDSEIGLIFRDENSCELKKRQLLKLVHALTNPEVRFLILDTTHLDLSHDARELILAVMSESVRASERTFFIHSHEETSWAQSCHYKMLLCPNNAFSLETYLSPSAQIGEELEHKLYAVHEPAFTPFPPNLSSEKEMDDEALPLKKFG